MSRQRRKKPKAPSSKRPEQPRATIADALSASHKNLTILYRAANNTNSTISCSLNTLTQAIWQAIWQAISQSFQVVHQLELATPENKQIAKGLSAYAIGLLQAIQTNNDSDRLYLKHTKKLCTAVNNMTQDAPETLMSKHIGETKLTHYSLDTGIDLLESHLDTLYAAVQSVDQTDSQEGKYFDLCSATQHVLLYQYEINKTLTDAQQDAISPVINDIYARYMQAASNYNRQMQSAVASNLHALLNSENSNKADLSSVVDEYQYTIQQSREIIKQLRALSVEGNAHAVQHIKSMTGFFNQLALICRHIANQPNEVASKDIAIQRQQAQLAVAASNFAIRLQKDSTSFKLSPSESRANTHPQKNTTAIHGLYAELSAKKAQTQLSYDTIINCVAQARLHLQNVKGKTACIQSRSGLADINLFTSMLTDNESETERLLSLVTNELAFLASIKKALGQKQSNFPLQSKAQRDYAHIVKDLQLSISQNLDEMKNPIEAITSLSAQVKQTCKQAIEQFTQTMTTAAASVSYMPPANIGNMTVRRQAIEVIEHNHHVDAESRPPASPPPVQAQAGLFSAVYSAQVSRVEPEPVDQAAGEVAASTQPKSRHSSVDSGTCFTEQPAWAIPANAFSTKSLANYATPQWLQNYTLSSDYYYDEDANQCFFNSKNTDNNVQVRYLPCHRNDQAVHALTSRYNTPGEISITQDAIQMASKLVDNYENNAETAVIQLIMSLSAILEQTQGKIKPGEYTITANYPVEVLAVVQAQMEVIRDHYTFAEHIDLQLIDNAIEQQVTLDQLPHCLAHVQYQIGKSTEAATNPFIRRLNNHYPQLAHVTERSARQQSPRPTLFGSQPQPREPSRQAIPQPVAVTVSC